MTRRKGYKYCFTFLASIASFLAITGVINIPVFSHVSIAIKSGYQHFLLFEPTTVHTPEMKYLATSILLLGWAGVIASPQVADLLIWIVDSAISITTGMTRIGLVLVVVARTGVEGVEKVLAGLARVVAGVVGVVGLWVSRIIINRLSRILYFLLTLIRITKQVQELKENSILNSEFIEWIPEEWQAELAELYGNLVKNGVSSRQTNLKVLEEYAGILFAVHVRSKLDNLLVSITEKTFK